MVNHWATWEFLHNGRVENKNKALSPLAFLVFQMLNLEPAAALVWVPGLVYLLRRKALRYLGLTYVFFLAGMMVLHAKDYYVVPIYPLLFAAGGLAWQTRFAHRTPVRQGRAFAFPAAMLTLAAISATRTWRTRPRIARTPPPGRCHSSMRTALDGRRKSTPSRKRMTR